MEAIHFILSKAAWNVNLPIRLFDVLNKTLNVVTIFNLITAPAMMVAEGLGYTFTFDKLVNATGDCNLCSCPLEPRFETGLYLVWKKYQVFTKAQRRF